MNDQHSLTESWHVENWEQNGWQVLRLLPTGHLLDETDGLAEALWALLAPSPHPRVVLDMQQIDFLSSSLMTVLVRIHKRAATSGGALHVCGLRSPCQDALCACRLHEVIPLFADCEQAAGYQSV